MTAPLPFTVHAALVTRRAGHEAVIAVILREPGRRAGMPSAR
jgi:hypothetical protein